MSHTERKSTTRPNTDMSTATVPGMVRVVTGTAIPALAIFRGMTDMVVVTGKVRHTREPVGTTLVARACGISQYRTVIPPIVIAKRRPATAVGTVPITAVRPTRRGRAEVISTSVKANDTRTRGRRRVTTTMVGRSVTKTSPIVTLAIAGVRPRLRTGRGPSRRRPVRPRTPMTRINAWGLPTRIRGRSKSRYTSGGKVIATTYTNVYYCDTRYSWCTSTTTYGPWTKSSLSCSSSYTYDTTKCVGTPYTYTWTEQSRYTTGGKVVGVNYKTVSYCDPTYSWCSMTSTYGAERPSGYTCAQMFGERNYSKQYNSRNGYYYTCRQEGTKTEYYTVKEWASTSWCDIRYSSSCRRFDDGYTAWTKSGSCSSAYSYTTSRCLAKTTTVNVPVYGWVDSTRACTYSEWFYGTCITNVGYTAWRDSGTCSSAYTRTLEKCVSRPETYYVDEYAWQKIRVRVPLRKSRPKSASCGPMAGYTSWASVGVCTSEYSKNHRAV